MTIKFESKITELQQKKSELDLDFLQSKKQEYQQWILELFESDEGDEKEAAIKFNKARDYHAKIKEIDFKMKNASKIAENIDKKIEFYQQRKEKVKNIPLYKDTEEWIAEILWKDYVYQLLKDRNQDKEVDLMKSRKLTGDVYNKYYEEIFTDLFEEAKKKYRSSSSQDKSQESAIVLPEWMHEYIKEKIKENDEFKCLSIDDIERCLKIALKKHSGQILDKHLRNRFRDLQTYKAAFNLITDLTTQYSEFKIIKEGKKINDNIMATQAKESLIDKSIQNQWDKQENVETRNERIEKLHNIWTIENVSERCQEYIDLWEECWGKFDDKLDFVNQLKKLLTTVTHVQFETLFKGLLEKIIQNNLRPIQKEGKKYLTYELGDWTSRRNIWIYPTGQIVNILRHDDYLRFIHTKPPVWRRKKS